MNKLPIQDWIPPSMHPRDLDESPLVRASIILVILLWWLGVAFFELPLMGILVAVYAFLLTFSVSMLVTASFQLLSQHNALEKLKRLAHS